MKVVFRTAALFICSSILVLAGPTAGSSARAQTAPSASPSPSPVTVERNQPSAAANQETTLAAAAAVQQPASERERRQKAYAKLLEGQRHLTETRRNQTAATLRLARQAFQEAAALDPKLAEAHTALAEIAFYFPPQDFDTTAREAAAAVRVDRDNFGAHRLLARLYSIRSGLRENNLNKAVAEQAINELREVARLDPNNAEAWALLGEFYQATGRTAEALNARARWAEAPASTDTRFFQFITGRELSPDAATARLGEGLLAAGRTAEAISAIRRAIAINPENKEYAELLGQALETGGIADGAAIAELQRIVAADPSNLTMPVLLARAQARAGRVEDAAATLKSAIARQPKADRERQLLRLSLAQVYADALRPLDAIAVYEESLKERGIANAPLTSDEDKIFAGDTLRKMVALYKSAGRPAEVAATIERMRRLLGADDPTPDAEQIEFLREQGKRREALQAIRDAERRYPDQPGFVSLEAQTLADLGRVDEAVALIRRQLNGSAEDFTEYLTISGLYSQAGRGREAVEAARRALELAPAERPDMTSGALIALASAQERAGDPKGSEESLRRVLAKDPNNATALNNLGYFLLERNERFPEALEMIQRAVRVRPTNSSFLDSLGWAYFKLGRLEEAERHLLEAARRNAASVTIQEHLGDVYQRRGKPDLARAAWQRALSRSVQPDETARIKAKLNGK
ncbi:MAG TPA: tetratricopeptide repeat protein [Pyrinomonadaceae bacterium]